MSTQICVTPATATATAFLGHTESLQKKIAACCRNGQLDLAIQLLSQASVPLAENIYCVLLQTCQKKRALHHTKQIRFHLSHHKPNISTSLHEHLVVAFAKCGALEGACNVLHACSHRTFFSWTAIISCCVELGRPQKAFHFLKCMRDDGVKPNHYTFVSLFKACGSILDIKQGRTLHEEAKDMGFLSYIYVVNSLISMYGKCGSITEAEEVFQRGANARDLVTWNAMLSAYIDLGENQKALQLFRQLHNEGINPDARTFIMGLLACHNNKEHVEVGEKVFSEEFSFDIGECIHAGAKKNCVLSNDFFLSTLIIMYGKCKSCARAENVFCSIGNPDIVQWNSMLTAYIELGLAVKTLQAFVQLNKEAKIPDQHTFVLALQACCLLAEEGIPFIQLGYAKLMALEIGEALLHDAWKQGYASNSFLNTAMISLYGKCGIIEKAEAIFSQVDRQRVTTWNAVLSTYIELGKGEKALQLYSTMQKEGVSPDSVTFVVAIQACCIILEKENASRLSSSVSLEIGKALHMDAEREGLDTKEFVGNTLLHMYGKCGAIDDAEKIFGQLPQYNIILWNTMLSVLAEQGLADKASILFLQMQETGILMNEGTLISILQASSVAGWMDLCMKIHFIIVAEGYDTYSTLITTLIHTYGNCASIADAKTAFSGLCQYDLISCSAYLDSLVQTCHFDACLEAFEFMRRIGLEPDGVTFYSLLSGCSHAGTVDIGIQCFEFLIRECCILPESRHYAIMLDLLGRAGDFRRLKNLLVTKNADLDMWFSLLGVCSVHGNVEMGKWAFDKILHMNPKDASAYILMWNIFTNAGMEESANEIDFLRQREGLDKVCLE